MATMIQPTPVLRGKDAEMVRQELLHPNVSKEHLSFLAECRTIYRMTDGSHKILRSAHERA